MFKLKLLGFFFNIYSAALYKSGFKITFKRINNDDVTCHVWGNGKPIKVVIESMCNRMPIIKYDPITEVDMKSNLIKSRSQTVRIPVSGSNFDIDLTNSFISGQFNVSDWVIILFQIDKANAKQNNYSAYFNHCQVKNIHIENGRNEIFPTPE